MGSSRLLEEHSWSQLKVMHATKSVFYVYTLDATGFTKPEPLLLTQQRTFFCRILTYVKY